MNKILPFEKTIQRILDRYINNNKINWIVSFGLYLCIHWTVAYSDSFQPDNFNQYSNIVPVLPSKAKIISTNLDLFPQNYLKNKTVKKDDTKKNFVKKTKFRRITAVPYPNAHMYTGNGIQASLMMGMDRDNIVGDNVIWDKTSVFHWQGQVSYFYYPMISGGLLSRLNAGKFTELSKKFESEYFIFSRMHFYNNPNSFFFGFGLGFKSLAVEGRKEESLPFLPNLRIEIGNGWRINRLVSITLGLENEWVFHFDSDIERKTNASIFGMEYERAGSISFNPGFALDLFYFIPHEDKSLGFFIYFETEWDYWYGSNFLQRNGHSIDTRGGLSIAF